VVVNEDPKATAFTVSVDAKFGTSTGISAGDRRLAITQHSLLTTRGYSAVVRCRSRSEHTLARRCKENTGLLAYCVDIECT
jgi:3,4-dihydroxy-2-butanone 4-phosphate synthase